MRSLTQSEYDEFGIFSQTSPLQSEQGRIFINAIGFYSNAVKSLTSLITFLDQKYDYSAEDLSSIIKSASEQKAKQLLPELQVKLGKGKNLMCPGPSEFMLAACDGMCTDQKTKAGVLDKTAEANWYSGCMYGCINHP